MLAPLKNIFSSGGQASSTFGGIFLHKREVGGGKGMNERTMIKRKMMITLMIGQVMIEIMG